MQLRVPVFQSPQPRFWFADHPGGLSHGGPN